MVFKSSANSFTFDELIEAGGKLERTLFQVEFVSSFFIEPWREYA